MNKVVVFLHNTQGEKSQTDFFRLQALPRETTNYPEPAAGMQLSLR
jgi:hypothetical protein